LYIMLYVKRNNFIFDDENVRLISERFNFSGLTSRILLSRGISVDEIAALLSDEKESFAQHEEIPHLSEAAQRIEEAMMAGEKIAVFGDYDADGICGTSIIINSLKSVGYDEVIYYIPNRISEGYGLNNYAIDQIKEQGCSLIVTVDCGISNIEEAEYACINGIDLIVTDHHLPGEILPKAINVNPKLSDNESLHMICGAMVALKLMCVLFDEDIYYENCDLAAIATIADMVELTGENRHVVKMGLKKINSKENKNIKYLTSECIKNDKTIKAEDIAYLVAPAINAAGRLDQADKCVELFIGGSLDPHETAAILVHDNSNRRRIEKETFDSAMKLIKNIDFSKNRAIILFDKCWHQGVLGIAASKLKNIFFRPVILFTENEGELVGSARSVDGLNVHEAIDYCSEYISRFGGHFMAAGLSMPYNNFDSFKTKFEEYLTNVHREIFRPKIGYDIEALPQEITMDFLKEIDRIEPFGKGNPPPILLLKNVETHNYSKMGDGNRHFRCKITCDELEIQAVAFSNSIQIDDKMKYDAIVSPQINEWNGKSSVQAVIRDIKPSFDENIWDEVLNLEEKAFKLSLSQAYYAGGGIETANANYEDLFNALDENDFSVMILAVDSISANNLKETLGKRFESLDVRLRHIEENKTNYNTLVLAPDIEMMNLEDYKHVFIVSEYAIGGMYKALQAKGKVYIISDYKTLDKKRFEMDIIRLREIYLTLKKAILNKSIDTVLGGNREIESWQARAGLRIFKEAGLIEYDMYNMNFVLADKKQVDITQSETFKNMQIGE